MISLYSGFARRRPLYDATTREIFFGPRPPIVIPPAADDTFWTWSDGDRLGIVAHRTWANPSLWWVICDVNDVVDPYGIAVGTRLRLPSRARVELAVTG